MQKQSEPLEINATVWKLIRNLDTDSERLVLINAILNYHFRHETPVLIGVLNYAFRVAKEIIDDQISDRIATAKELKARAKKIICDAEREGIIARRKARRQQIERSTQKGKNGH